MELNAIDGLRLFFALLVISLLTSSKSNSSHNLFLAARGRSHRLAGAAHLCCLLAGAVLVIQPNNEIHITTTIIRNNDNDYIFNNADDDDNNITTTHHDEYHYWSQKCLAYDILLGTLGILVTLTAASDFPHRHIVTNQKGESGTLSRKAIVTHGEMMEHAFYQILNLWQALYLHFVTWLVLGDGGRGGAEEEEEGEGRMVVIGRRMALLWVVTLPWAARGFFPINSFSANWTKQQQRDDGNNEVVEDNKRGYQIMGTTKIREKGSISATTTKTRTPPITNTRTKTSINRMYQIKKWQYIFYKHVILHGLNISMAFPIGIHDNADTNDDVALPLTHHWRVFWLALNTSYVMEFFLQSIVKRGILRQRHMMILNGLLMASSSVAAFRAVMGRVRMEAALLSLLLNFVNRHHDILNTMVVGCIVANI